MWKSHSEHVYEIIKELDEPSETEIKQELEKEIVKLLKSL
jgi:hypothetical protein